MDERIFPPEPMGLRDDLLGMPLEQRFTYRPAERLFFVNFEGHVVRSAAGIEQIRHLVRSGCCRSGIRSMRSSTTNSFSILPDCRRCLFGDGAAICRPFLSRAPRAIRPTASCAGKAGRRAEPAAVAPHIYECAEEARAHLREPEGKAAADGSGFADGQARKGGQTNGASGSSERRCGWQRASAHPEKNRSRTPSKCSRISPTAAKTLGRLYAERLKSDDGYQVIDPG